MISGKQILWGTLGWAFGGPIGGILGVIFAGIGRSELLQKYKTISGRRLYGLSFGSFCKGYES